MYLSIYLSRQKTDGRTTTYSKRVHVR